MRATDRGVHMSDGGKTVGVLGGMGPDATVDFMAKVIAATPASRDQDHLHMIVDHNPAVPDRQEALLAGGVDPGPEIAAMAKRLEIAGADFLVMPCNTAHAFRAHILAVCQVPMLSIVEVTVAACRGHGRIGLLATPGCLRSHVYQDTIAENGLEAILQDEEEIAELMRLVYRVKSGDRGAEVAAGMQQLAAGLIARGAECIIAGCTEIPLVLEAAAIDAPLISSTDVLAEQTVAHARGQATFANQE